MPGKENLIPDSDTFIPGREQSSPSNYRVKERPRKIVNMGIEKLSRRHRQALENIAENPQKPRQGVIAAGFSPANATAVATRLLQRKPIVEALEAKGGTDEKIAAGIVEGMTKAENPFRPGLPDHIVRLGFIKEANRVKDNYPPTKVNVKKTGGVMHVHFTAENLKQFKKYNDIRMGAREEADE